MAKKKSNEEHPTTQSGKRSVDNFAGRIREAGGGRDKKGKFMSSEAIIEDAPNAHFRIIEEANRNRESEEKGPKR